MPSHDHDLLHHLSLAYGIVPDYYDNWGRCHVATDETKRALLQAMGVRVDSGEALAEEAASLEARRWRSPCDPILVVVDGKGVRTWSFRFPAAAGEEASARVEWEVRDEAGASVRRGQAGPGLVPKTDGQVAGDRYVEVDLPLPADLPAGYYTIRATGGVGRRSTEGLLALVLAPGQCYVPDAVLQGLRSWGLSLQLYGLRSARNWGIGDFGDLTELLRWAFPELGIGLIGLNPLHALKNRHPFHISPYAPDSRFFLNAIYVDVEHVPEFREAPTARRLLEDPELRAALEVARRDELVDYGAIWKLKRTVLREAFTDFLARHGVERDEGWQPRDDSERGRAFAAYVEREGVPLKLYATFQAISERFEQADPPTWVWWDWPTSLKNPHSAEVAAFQRMHQRDVLFYAYLQFVAEEQLAGAAGAARDSEMPVGLYLDLALGSERAGSDAWVYADQFARGAEAGAPPDAFTPEGQNWGLPPLNPRRIREDGYRVFIQLLRRVMRHARAIRLDHVMSLFRLFWVPEGQPASAGAYVTYPSEDLLGILALESVRHRTMVIGEDLGTVPDSVRKGLEAARVLSYRVATFERQPDRSFTPSVGYPAQAVAVVNTPDLPTLAGFWSGRDLAVRRELGFLMDDKARLEALEQRQADKRQLVRALVTEHLWPAGVAQARALDGALSLELSLAIHAFLGRTPCWFVLAALEDVLGEVEQTNLPGTLNEHPNWMRKRGPALTELRRDPRLHRLAVSMRLHRPAS